MGHVTDTLYESCSVRWRGRDTGLLTQTYIAQKKTKQNKKGERWIVVTRKLNVVPFNSPFFLRWKLGTGVVDMLDCIWPEKRDEAPFWGRLLLLWIHNCQTWLLCDVTRPWRGSLTTLVTSLGVNMSVYTFWRHILDGSAQSDGRWNSKYLTAVLRRKSG